MYESLKKNISIRLTVVGLVVMGGFVASLLFLPGLMKQAVTDHQDTKGRFEALVGVDYDISQLEHNYTQIEGETQILFQSLPPQLEIFRVIDQLEKIAGDVGMVQTVQVSDMLVTADNLSGVPVEVELRGDLKGLIEYLKRVENLKYFVQENDVSYEAKYTTTEEGEGAVEGINATANLTIYTEPTE